MADIRLVGDLTVTRWRRSGKDRLYVNDRAENRVGWLDLLTGARHLEAPAEAAAFAAAIEEFLAESRAGWTDLAANVPGQAAREQANSEWAAMRERGGIRSFLARGFDLNTAERAWRVGADGEETVGVRLDTLRNYGWRVLHAVPVGDRGSDIDHVVIGTGGVWTVNTKTHPGGRVWVGRTAIRVNGQGVPYLRNARFEATRAERLLSEAVGFAVAVRPALVFLTGSLIPNVTIKQRPDGVDVLDRRDIPRVFRRAAPKLTVEQAAAVYELARRSTTWRPRTG